MIRISNATAIVVLFVALCCNFAQGQSPSQTTLVIDVQNAVEYFGDISDPTKFATNPNLTEPATVKNLIVVTLIADIVAVNGQPAKGVYVGRSQGILLSPAPDGSLHLEGIADVTHDTLREHIFEVLKSDGTPVGTIMSFGFTSGPAPPGTPLIPGRSTAGGANFAIVGGTGAFLGARGQVSGTGGHGRQASMAEDPLYRRINGGTSYSWVIHLMPMSVPQIAMTAAGPAVFHADFSPVTSASPARGGEVLIVQATGLGPTVPGIDPGQPFPTDVLQAVNSPVAVTVNGQAAEVVNSIGWPGQVDTYRVDFRVPAETAKAAASIQVSAAWIAGRPVSITVQ